MISSMRLDQTSRNLTLVAVGLQVLLLVIFTSPLGFAAPVAPGAPPILPKTGAPVDIKAEVEDELWRASRVLREKSWVVLGGYVSGLLREPRTDSMLTAHLAFQRDRWDESSEAVALMIGSQQIWGAHWDISHYCCMGGFNELYWGYGIGSFWKTEDQLASFADTDSYHLRARVGLENLLKQKRRLRSEFVLRASPLGLSGEALIGWTFDP